MLLLNKKGQRGTIADRFIWSDAEVVVQKKGFGGSCYSVLVKVEN